ncbi:MAG: FAD-dependent oxidoreductase [Dehalococcoidia bacterium]
MQTHVIAGAGQAGAHAAIALRRAGFAGRIVLIGEEMVAPYDRPPLSKAYLTSSDATPLVYHFPPETFAREEIELVTGIRVEGINPKQGRVHLATGGTIDYDRVIIATGSTARKLDVPGAESAFVLRSFGDALRIRELLGHPRRVVCIGAGVIGLEVASAAIARGSAVTVVERVSTVMSRSLHPEIAAHVEALHRRAGVEFLFGTGVERIEGTGVILSNGARLEADAVLLGIGIERNLALATGAGLKVDRGVLVNASGETSVAGVYAAGEVAEYYSERLGCNVLQEAWQHAQDHGAFVGRNAAGIRDTYDPVPWFWSDQYGVNIQVAGHVSDAGRIVLRGDPASGEFSIFCLGRDDRISGAVGFNAGRDVSAAQRMMRSGVRVEPGELSDSRLNLRSLINSAPRTSSVGASPQG